MIYRSAQRQLRELQDSSELIKKRNREIEFENQKVKMQIEENSRSPTSAPEIDKKIHQIEGLVQQISAYNE